MPKSRSVAGRRRRNAPTPAGEVLVPKLPHERDESPDPESGADRVTVERAAADLAAGQEDTDCYGAARRIFRRAAVRQKR